MLHADSETKCGVVRAGDECVCRHMPPSRQGVVVPELSLAFALTALRIFDVTVKIQRVISARSGLSVHKGSSGPRGVLRWSGWSTATRSSSPVRPDLFLPLLDPPARPRGHLTLPELQPWACAERQPRSPLTWLSFLSGAQCQSLRPCGESSVLVD